MISELFTNLREFSIATQGLDFTEDAIPYEKIKDIRNYESDLLFDSFLGLFDFAETVDFAKTAKTKIGVQVQQKNRTITCNPSKSYPCGKSCKGKDKLCVNPVEGQAKTFTEFLKLHNKLNKKSVQKPPDKKDKGKPEGKATTTTDLQVPTGTIPRIERSAKLVAVKKLSSNYNKPDTTDVDNLAKAALVTRNISPIVAKRTSLQSFDVVEGSKSLAAVQKARELNPKKAEMSYVYVAEDDDQLEAYKYQMKFYKEPQNVKDLPEPRPRTADENTNATTKLGQDALVNARKIEDKTDYSKDKEAIELLAQSQINTGNILPIIVKRTGLQSFEVVSGGLALAAAKRARELKPIGNEQVRIFIAENDEEANYLKNQAGEVINPLKIKK